MRFYNHIPARQIRNRIRPALWQSCFKFCVERNPWDRVVSYFHYRQHHDPGLFTSFSAFIRSGDVLDLKRCGIDLYTIDGEVVVDRICRFENLAQEMEEVFAQVGIEEDRELPKAKSQFRPSNIEYRAPYDDADRILVGDIFGDEIELLGYAF